MKKINFFIIFTAIISLTQNVSFANDYYNQPSTSNSYSNLSEIDGDDDEDGVLNSIDMCPATPLDVVVDEDGCPQSIDVTDVINMELRVFFDNEKSVVKDAYNAEIMKVVSKMNEYPNAIVGIEGHASAAETNPDSISFTRASVIKKLLVSYGINPSRIQIEGYSYDRPIADNNTAEGRAMNRRAYAIISGNKQSTTIRTHDMNIQ